MRTGKYKEKLAAQGFVLVSEAAERVGTAPATVTKWIKDGHIKSITVAGTRFIEWASLLKHLGPEGAKLLGFGEGKVTP